MWSFWFEACCCSITTAVANCEKFFFQSHLSCRREFVPFAFSLLFFSLSQTTMLIWSEETISSTFTPTPPYRHRRLLFGFGLISGRKKSLLLRCIVALESVHLYKFVTLKIISMVGVKSKILEREKKLEKIAFRTGRALQSKISKPYLVSDNIGNLFLSPQMISISKVVQYIKEVLGK